MAWACSCEISPCFTHRSSRRAKGVIIVEKW